MRASSSAAPRGKASRAAGGGLVAVVYVSEGKDASVVDALESTAERACATHGARVVNVFRDVEYNRTGFTLGVRVGADGTTYEIDILPARGSDGVERLLPRVIWEVIFSFLVFEEGYRDARPAKRRRTCLLYTSPSPRDLSTSRMPSSA